MPNTNGTASYDSASADNMTFGLLRDFKSALKNYMIYVPTGTLGAPEVSASLNGPNLTAMITASYGPLLELPYITNDATVINQICFHPDFTVKWSAPETYGYGPAFYTDHKEFSEFVKIVGKDHSLLPEYRISDHLGS